MQKTVSTRRCRIAGQVCVVEEATAPKGTFVGGFTRLWTVDRQLPDLDFPGMGRCSQWERVTWSGVSEADAVAKAKAVLTGKGKAG
ncbi:MAG TPA: hypothetical protein VLD58_07680 [Gemmatimonadales bacterium]|nr:hypothetical protein [Gemmatimonadales bacterium]